MSNLLRKTDVVRFFGDNMAATARACVSPRKPKGLSRVAVVRWGEYVPELTAIRLLENYPALREFVVDPASGLTLQEMRNAVAAAPQSTEGQAST